MDINSHLSLSHVTSRFTSWLFLSISFSWSLSSSGSLYIIEVFVLSSTVWQWNTEVNCKTCLGHAVGRWEVMRWHYKLFRCASFHMKRKTFLRFRRSFTWQRRAGSPQSHYIFENMFQSKSFETAAFLPAVEMAERRAWKHSDIMATLLMYSQRTRGQQTTVVDSELCA